MCRDRADASKKQEEKKPLPMDVAEIPLPQGVYLRVLGPGSGMTRSSFGVYVAEDEMTEC